MKPILKNVIIFLVVANQLVFISLAFAGKLPADPKQLIFIDFWGRFCVYSLWFIGYALYRKYLADKPVIRTLVILALCINIPLFLGLGYFDKLSTAPEAVAVNDFWGRLTVYSLWFMAYEAFRTYFSPKPSASPPTGQEA
jgi:hypothetical protein